MSSKDACGRPEAASPNPSGVRLFKSMVRRVRHKITENKMSKSPSLGEDVSAVVATLEELSVDGSSAHTSPQRLADQQPKSPPGNKEALRRLFGATRTSSEDRLRGNGGYSSDSGTDKQARQNDYRVRIRQNLRSRSKSYSRTEKKPKKILRPPATYDYVRGPSGLVSHRVRVY